MKTKFNLSKVSKAVMLGCMAAITSFSTMALEEVSDNELAKVTGRELATFSTIKPGELGNPNGNVGFYRFSLNGKIELNSNINKLRLGCDDASGNGPCDLSIDKLSLTGLVPKLRNGQKINYPFIDANNGTNGEKETVFKKLDNVKANLKQPFEVQKDVGPGTDFVLDKPFIELAIKNPDSLTDRKLVGYRFGAEENWGTMSTGQGPALVNNAQEVEIFGPGAQGGIESYGKGEGALDRMWNAMKGSAYWGDTEAKRFKAYKRFVNASIERGHTGVNYISGRLPTRLDNLNINARVFNALGTLSARAQTAVVAGNLNRQNDADFGLYINSDGANGQTKGYLRNTFLGDSDTVYDTATYGDYVGNGISTSNKYKLPELRGRALELKRASRAQINDMVVHVHSIDALGGTLEQIFGLNTLLGGDKINNQSIATKVFHQLQFGQDLNGNGKYDPGEGSKHQAFSYQTLDGLQWITTDKRIANAYDNLGNPDTSAAGFRYLGPAGGYDWLSTRAGWWLESPLATVSNAYVPKGQTATLGAPKDGEPIKLGSLDLGDRPVDNCYGQLNFC